MSYYTRIIKVEDLSKYLDLTKYDLENCEENCEEPLWSYPKEDIDEAICYYGHDLIYNYKDKRFYEVEEEDFENIIRLEKISREKEKWG